MKWSKARQRMAARLQAIERAQRAAAELRLASARSDADSAEERAREARLRAGEAERDWADRLGAGRFDVELQRVLSDELLRKERELADREVQRSDADSAFDRQRHEWQHLEAGVKAGDELLRRGRRFLSRRSNDSRDAAISHQATWKWFRR